MEPWRTVDRTRQLSAWLSASDAAATPPAPTASEATDLLRLARHWHVSPALWLRVRHTSANAAWPEDIARALRDDFFLNASRNQRLRSTLLGLSAEFSSAGLEPLLLKGAIHLVASPTRNAAQRIMGDLDILFRPEQTTPAFQLLLKLGWILDPDCEPAPESLHHLSRLIHPDHDTPIEIHRHPIIRSSVEWTRRFFADSVPAPEVPHPVRLPSIGHRLLNNALHAFDDDEFVHACAWETTTQEPAIRRTNLRQLLDFADHARASHPEVDWSQILADATQLQRGDDVRQWTWLAHHLLGLDVPSHVRGWPAFRPEVMRTSTFFHYSLRSLARLVGWQGGI